jgi:hypothetical protein
MLPDLVSEKTAEGFLNGVSNKVVQRYVVKYYEDYKIGADPVCSESYRDYEYAFIAARQ